MALIHVPPIPDQNQLSTIKLGGRLGHLRSDFDVFFDHPLPRFAPSNVHVYHAKSSRGHPCLAYICDRTTVPRLNISEKYTALQSTHIPRLVGRGIITSPEGVERYGFIYENTFGNPIIPNTGEPEAYGWRPDTVLNIVIKPLVSLLQEIHNADMVHGNIRASNLFDGGTTPLQRIIVGDCLSGTYLSSQPELYLPPPLAIAQPMGRGLGAASDDLYALGVTCAVLLRTQDPFFGKSKEELLMSKIDLGTFSTLIENERVPSNLLELLRGLLYDDPETRWTIADILEWADGKRVGHRQGSKRLKGSRHIILGTEKILLPSLLAHHAARNVSGAMKLIESGDIKQWIRRSVSDARLETRYDEAVESGHEHVAHPNGPERTVARLCAAMEPQFPILYEKLALFPDSFGLVLGDLIVHDQNVKPIVELMNDQIVPFWMNMQYELPADFNMIINKFEQCQQFIKQRLIGYGIERCLYFLAPDIHCLSPALQNFYVHTSEQMIHALDIISETKSRPERLLDRHMIAFLSMRERHVIERYLPELGANEPYRTATGVISVLSAIQLTSHKTPLPGLSKWVTEIAEPLYARFHDRDIQKSIRKKVEDLKESGSIIKIADTLFDQDRIRRDQNEFRHAMNEYYNLSIQKIQMTEALKTQGRFGVQAGRDLAALLAGLLMSLSAAGFVLMHLLKGGMQW